MVTQRAAGCYHERNRYKISNVIIALLLWVGNRIPKKGVYFLCQDPKKKNPIEKMDDMK